MHILIVETVWTGGGRYKFLEKTLLTTLSILPTLQAREFAAITPKHHTVSVVNERYSRINYNKMYDVVLINFVTSTAPRAYAIADHFRKKGVLVVLSGFHASGVPEEAKRYADSVLIGRNEQEWLKILQDIERKHLDPYYRAPPYDSSQSIPPSNISLPGLVITGAIEATRGCPYQCEFCPETSIQGGAFYYKRPIPDVIAEIKKLPQKTLMFYDTSLTIDPSYTKELFTEMKGLHKKFFCNGNVDILACDTELVRLSKEAGCLAWLIGFESINQNTLQAIGKTTNRVEEYTHAIENIHQNKMVVIGDFMFGFDNDTPDIFGKTLKTIQELQIDVADFSILTPFPGTPLFKKLEDEQRILTKEWKYYNMRNVVYKPKQITPEELRRGVQYMYNEFYKPSLSLKRIFQNLHRGLFPFFIVLARHVMILMSRGRNF